MLWLLLPFSCQIHLQQPVACPPDSASLSAIAGPLGETESAQGVERDSFLLLLVILLLSQLSALGAGVRLTACWILEGRLHIVCYFWWIRCCRSFICYPTVFPSVIAVQWPRGGERSVEGTRFQCLVQVRPLRRASEGARGTDHLWWLVTLPCGLAL